MPNDAENITGPAAPEPRVPITITIKTANRDWLDTVAHEHRLSRADVVRIALAVARQNGNDFARALKNAAEHP